MVDVDGNTSLHTVCALRCLVWDVIPVPYPKLILPGSQNEPFAILRRYAIGDLDTAPCHAPIWLVSHTTIRRHPTLRTDLLIALQLAGPTGLLLLRKQPGS